MFPACFLSFGVGFLSLSLEILWIRLFSFVNYSLPQSFAFVLVLYLLGIAFGALFGKRFCDNHHPLWSVSGVILFFSSVTDALSPWLYSFNAHLLFQCIYAGALILLSAALKAIIFPIAHHLGTSSSGKHIGRSLSRVYVSNILGATLGPLFMGLILLSLFSTQQCFLICSGLTLLLSLYCFSGMRTPLITMVYGLSFCIVAMVGLFINPNQLIKTIAVKEGNLRRVVENEYGIITTYFDKPDDDKIYGGNVYDGRTNLDPIKNSNHINRLLIMSVIQESPEHILMIGLSIGTWLKLVTSFPNVKTIDVIELNPGYLTAMKDYPKQYSALSDSRVHLYIDDGRRWLKAHPEKHYDLAIMNTTFHWRAYASNLLSSEFLQLVKQHLTEKGVLTYNTTGSPEAFKTATTIFKHAYLYENFVIASDKDWRDKLEAPTAIKKLSSLRLDGELLFAPNSEMIVTHFLRVPIVSISDLFASHAFGERHLDVITDRNLISEYKYGKGLNI